jgi:hypothetical protein
MKGAVYGCNFAAGGRLRAELYIDSGDGEANLELFRTLKERAQAIEAAYGKALSWEELPGRRACRIADYTDGDVTNTDQHDAYIDWFFETGNRLREALARSADHGLGRQPSLAPLPRVRTADKVRVFISFDPDYDLDLKNALVGQSRVPDPTFNITDWSIKDPSSEWKEKARHRIRRVDQVAVICGEHTDAAKGVSEEIRIARDEERPYFLLEGRADKACRKPKAALSSDKMYKWTWENLNRLIGGAR